MKPLPLLLLLIAVPLGFALVPRGVSANPQPIKTSAEDKRALPQQPSIRYDRGLVDVQTENVPLGRVLSELARKSGVQVSFTDLAIAQWPVSVSIAGIPLLEGIKGILDGFSYAIYHAADISGIIVLSTQPNRFFLDEHSAINAKRVASESGYQGASLEKMVPAKIAQDMDPADEASFEKLRQSAMADPTTRKELIERYKNAPEGEAKEALRALLSGVPTPDVVAFFMELASAGDALQRKAGFEMLVNLGATLPEARQIARQALETEQDPAILSQAIAMLEPAVVEPSERAAVLKQLQGLVKHTEPVVRAQSIGALAAWDKTGESADALQQALADSSELVRGAAVSAIAANRIRSDSLKSALLSIANNANESPGIRLNAASTLERFALNRDESTDIIQSAMEAQGQLDQDMPSLDQTSQLEITTDRRSIGSP
jgi:hypothetical protein